ncbi:hypothetical protein [Bradyrhizobium sp. USDA 10063]
MAGLNEAQRAAEIVRDAGGQIVGRTRLQKIAYILEAVGLGAGFPFRYKHYGPYSEQLADAAQTARIFGMLNEQETHAAWGGVYSIYHSLLPPEVRVPEARLRLAQELVSADAVELELAATALFLAYERFQDPWGETARRKPDKAEGGRLQRAHQLYQRLRSVPTPRSLPSI